MQMMLSSSVGVAAGAKVNSSSVFMLSICSCIDSFVGASSSESSSATISSEMKKLFVRSSL